MTKRKTDVGSKARRAVGTRTVFLGILGLCALLFTACPPAQVPPITPPTVPATPWARTVTAGTNSSQFNSVAIDVAGNVYAAGFQTDAIIYSYGPEVTVRGKSYSQNVLLVKYNSEGTVQWARTETAGTLEGGSEFASVAVDASGNIYAAGEQTGTGSFGYGNSVTAKGTSSNENILLVKYNSEGTTQWARTSTAGTAGSCFNSIAIDAAGNIYVTGYQWGTGDFVYGNSVTAKGTSSNENILLVKYNSEGIAQWARTVTAGTDFSKFNSVAIDTEGNVYAAGFQKGEENYGYGTSITATGTSTNNNVILVKYNSEGIAQWARTSIAGTGGSCFNSIAIDATGNIYAVGEQRWTESFGYGNGVTAAGTGSSNIILVKYTNAGIAQWARTLTTGTSIAYFNYTSLDTTGNIYAVGEQRGTGSFGYGNSVSAIGTSSSRNILLVKYNSSGTAQWARSLTAGTDTTIFRSVAVDTSGYIYAAGFQSGTESYGYGIGVTAAGTSSTQNVLLVKYLP